MLSKIMYEEKGDNFGAIAQKPFFRKIYQEKNSF
jgi:hypothetical protein